MDVSWLGPPLDVRPLFPEERAELLGLLASLSPADRTRPTVCPGWDVGDVTAHILHGYVRRLSNGRDDHRGGPSPGPGESLPAFLTRANEDFVATSRQLSPRLTADLIAHLGPQVDALWADAVLAGPAGVAVSWASPDAPTPAWLDLAREYTERWTHQQQIRDAVLRPGADAPRLLGPVLDTFLRALPQTLRGVDAAVGSGVRVTVPGSAGGRWTAVRRPERWELADDRGPPAAEVVIGADTLWRLATRGIGPGEARRRAELHGDALLCDAVLGILAVVR
ncbi:maleylpyruvate isomerase family mycothiol-dependent enzyme [Streptomyces avicenniae]|uniref:maleylpyruvate isomerase family mycothiol-dependent enzyme n=1 Tax=Streptomyces avicenniae TaxID=500153 RepID=UPI0006995998|nr:maleylpyruvate isomerase family mycothiol-dependent enzyme [Streptomyces avicenniae]